MTEETTSTDTTTSRIDAPVEAVTEAPAVQVGGAEAETSVLGGEAEVEQVTALEGAPEAYALALEGTELDAEAVAEAEPVLRELNLSNEQANKLLPVAAALVQKTADRTMQAMVEAGAAQRKEWLDAFKADPDIGGANEAATTHLAAKGLEALGFDKTHPFRKILTESGFGNHPDMIRAFRKVGEMVAEDSMVRSDAGQTPGDPLDALYPNNRRSK